MARGQIIVETAQLDSTAGRVEQMAGDYRSEYTALFSLVASLKSAWDGEDNVAFTNQIEGFRDDFQRMEQLMRDYAAYLRKAAQAYRDTQDTVASQAKTLSQGN